MYIEKILSYKGAWDLATTKYSNQIAELQDLIAHFVETSELPLSPMKASREFDSLLRAHGWQELRKVHIGPIKGGVSADFTYASPAFLNRWIFHRSVVAIRKEIVELPILILPCSDNTIFERTININSIEYFENQLAEISPLSHQYRFLVLGFTNQARDMMPDVVELESDPLVGEANQVINRIIEFPPEYHQAGIGILNFFGTYLREQYPNADAKVKIIQEGLKVRMVIETLDGESETIEKALHEYQLIVSGQATPEKFTTNDKLVIELKNELRFAKLRVETQQDFIGLQNSRIDRLLQIVEIGLSNKQPIAIDFKPTISLSNTIHFNPDISFALGGINELKDALSESSEAHVTLEEIEGSLEAIEKEKDPEVIRKSSAMSKFKRFIDKVTEGNNEVEKAIKAVEHGWDIFKDLAGKYNSIAQWCGLPQVPTMFTKN